MESICNTASLGEPRGVDGRIYESHDSTQLQHVVSISKSIMEATAKRSINSLNTWRQQRQTLIGPQFRGYKHIVSDIGARRTVNGRVTSCICEDLKERY